MLVGHSTEVQLTVATTGPRTERTFRVTHGGTEVSTRTVTLPANSTVEIEFEITFEDPGTGTVEVNGVRASGLTVATTSKEPTTTADVVDKADRFTLVLGLIAFAVSTIWAGTSISRRGL